MLSLVLITLAAGAAAETTPLTCPTAEIPPASVHKLIVAARFRSTAWRCGSLAARFSGFCAQEVPPRIMPVIYDVVFPRQRGQRVRRQSRLPPDLLRPLRPVPVAGEDACRYDPTKWYRHYEPFPLELATKPVVVDMDLTGPAEDE